MVELIEVRAVLATLIVAAYGTNLFLAVAKQKMEALYFVAAGMEHEAALVGELPKSFATGM